MPQIQSPLIHPVPGDSAQGSDPGGLRRLEVSPEFKLTQVLDLFHDLFFKTLENPEAEAVAPVKLVGGFAEPFYLAPLESRPAEIRFTRDYLNSCFHEVAHWCIAGKARRLKNDYGYWYRPDGRTGAQQRDFFQVEAGPQALEWAFATACGEVFRMSCDNLAGEVQGEEEFDVGLRLKLGQYLEAGFPDRSRRFLEKLMGHFHPEVHMHDIPGWLMARTLSADSEIG